MTMLSTEDITLGLYIWVRSDQESAMQFAFIKVNSMVKYKDHPTLDVAALLRHLAQHLNWLNDRFS